MVAVAERCKGRCRRQSAIRPKIRDQNAQ
jgi:hypothetical protein